MYCKSVGVVLKPTPSGYTLYGVADYYGCYKWSSNCLPFQSTWVHPFGRSLFFHLYFFFWPLCSLFFFDVWILIILLVSSNYYSRQIYHDDVIFTKKCKVLFSVPFWVWIFLPNFLGVTNCDIAIICEHKVHCFIRII